MKYLLDTHVWISWNAKPEALPKKIVDTLKRGEYAELLLSVISIWEFSKLLEKNRLTISLDGRQWISRALEIPRLRLVPLTTDIVWISTQLPGIFHDDPTDQIIVATARVENAIVVTLDKLILKYPHVRCMR